MQRLQDSHSILVAKHNRLNYQVLELVALIERLETRLVRLRRFVSPDDFMSGSLTAKAAMAMAMPLSQQMAMPLSQRAWLDGMLFRPTKFPPRRWISPSMR